MDPQYEPWRASVKDTKEDWEKLASMSKALSKALEAEEKSTRELTELLCNHAAHDRSRFVMGGE
jgi:hypothetical protein